MSVLDGYLASEITDALSAADIPQSATVTVQETSGPPWEPIIVDVAYACAGWIDEYEALDRANSDILQSDRKAFIVASTLTPTPVPGNTVTIAGATFAIISVARDPAGACWVLQCRV